MNTWTVIINGVEYPPESNLNEIEIKVFPIFKKMNKSAQKKYKQMSSINRGRQKRKIKNIKRQISDLAYFEIKKQGFPIVGSKLDVSLEKELFSKFKSRLLFHVRTGGLNAK